MCRFIQYIVLYASFCAPYLDSLITDMENYYDDFDVDEETYLWLDNRGHGKNGAPYRMRDVLEDMEAAEKMVEDLLDAIREIA